MDSQRVSDNESKFHTNLQQRKQKYASQTILICLVTELERQII